MRKYFRQELFSIKEKVIKEVGSVSEEVN